MCAQFGFGQTMSLDEPLYEAVSKSQLAVVKDLLRKGANPNSTYANDWPLLFRALDKSEEKDGYAVLQVLIDAGAKVNAKQPEQGWTPLHNSVATMIGSTKVTELLIRHGANLESQMPGSGTPLHLAAFWGRLDSVNVLLKHGANIEARTELDGSLNYGHNRQSLESFGGEPGYDQVGQTPLMKAASNVHNQTNIVEALLGHGANIHASDSMGHTALHMAALSKNLAAVKLLISRGAKVDARSKGGLTPLHVAVRPHAMLGNGLPVAEFFLESGADPNARTARGLSVTKCICRLTKPF
jgi:ankyrin repeat protein